MAREKVEKCATATVVADAIATATAVNRLAFLFVKQTNE